MRGHSLPLLNGLRGIGPGVMRRVRIRQSLDVEALITAAKRRTHLCDFGEPCPNEPLERLTRSLNGEAALSFIGRLVAHEDLVHLLANRLLLQADRDRYPGIAAQRIERPLFITGLPRSGTTFLHELLAQDPAHRAPLTWEVRRPSPPPALSGAGRAVRIREAERELRSFAMMAPRFKRIHPMGACLPQECIEILSYTLFSARFHTSYFVPAYQTWLDAQDMAPAYAWHKRFVQHLQWGDARDRWVLKAPAHLFALDALLRIYPDAVIVQTHRHPTSVIGSMLSMTTVLQEAFSSGRDRHVVALDVIRRWSMMMERAMRERARAEQGLGCTFIDVDYGDLTRAPVNTVRRIYRRLGWRLNAEALTGMRAWLAGHPQHRDGPHLYSLEEFGFSTGEITRLFQNYILRYEVPVEGARRGAEGRDA